MNTGNCRLLFLALLVIFAGCRKQTPVAPAATEQTQPPVAENPQPLAGEVDPFMTSQLRIFIQQKGRLPTDFGELARTRLDVVPRTRPGTKWAIDPATQEVKLVRN